MPRNSLLCTWWLTGFMRKDSGTSNASSTSERLMVREKPGRTRATVGRMRKPKPVP